MSYVLDLQNTENAHVAALPPNSVMSVSFPCPESTVSLRCWG